MILSKRAIENRLIRFNNCVKELKVRNTSRIDKIKYYGVGVNISNIEKHIINTFYDKELLKQFNITNRTEALDDDITKYFEEVQKKVKDAIDLINGDIEESFRKGSKRFLDTNGDKIKGNDNETQLNNQALKVIQASQIQYLQNLNVELQKKVKNILVEELKKNQDPKQIAKELQSNIKTLSKNRAKTIARSEVIKAHNVGQVDTMQQLGVKRYIFWTAQDKRVCKVCLGFQGSVSDPNIYNLDRAGTTEAPLPVTNTHPNCRCTILMKD